MPTPYAYVGIIGGVVALGFLIYSIFTNAPEPERGYQNRDNGQSRTRYESGYDKPRDADWGDNEETSSSRRRRAHKPECTICTEALENETSSRLTLKCNHSFHRNCILEWFKSARENGFARTCPVCRADA